MIVNSTKFSHSSQYRVSYEVARNFAWHVSSTRVAKVQKNTINIWLNGTVWKSLNEGGK